MQWLKKKKKLRSGHVMRQMYSNVNRQAWPSGKDFW